MSSSQARLIPKDVKEELRLIYSYDGYKYHRSLMNYILAFTTCTSFLWGVKFSLTKNISNIFFTPFKLGIIAAFYPVIFLKFNSNRIIKVLLESDGKTAYAIIYGDLKNGLVKFDADQGIWTKKGGNFVLNLDGKQFFLDQEGKIHDIQAFYGILRSLSIHKDFIKHEEIEEL